MRGVAILPLLQKRRKTFKCFACVHTFLVFVYRVIEYLFSKVEIRRTLPLRLRRIVPTDFLLL